MSPPQVRCCVYNILKTLTHHMLENIQYTIDFWDDTDVHLVKLKLCVTLGRTVIFVTYLFEDSFRLALK